MTENAVKMIFSLYVLIKSTSYAGFLIRDGKKGRGIFLFLFIILGIYLAF